MQKFIEKIKQGGIGVLPTDTIYGLVGDALNKKSVEKIYAVKKRPTSKPFIVLICDIRQLSLFEVKITPKIRKILSKYWPGKISIVLPCTTNRFKYLHRGKKSLAFRLPAKKDLIKIIQKAGPLVAPSVNLEGRPPAKTIDDAKKYFDKKVDFYIDQGQLDSRSSKIIKIEKGKIITLRH